MRMSRANQVEAPFLIIGQFGIVVKKQNIEVRPARAGGHRDVVLTRYRVIQADDPDAEIGQNDAVVSQKRGGQKGQSVNRIF